MKFLVLISVDFDVTDQPTTDEIFCTYQIIGGGGGEKGVK
jgi:hypothetical protein